MTIGVAGVAFALFAGGLALYLVMTATLNRSVDDAARSTARQVAVMVDAARLPDPIPAAGAQVVQVLDGANRVVGGSVGADRLTPLVSPAERERLAAGDAVTVPGRRAALAGLLRVAGVQAGPATGRLLVVAAVPTADLETSRGVLRRLLLVFFPVVLTGLALVAWRIIGSALRPVEDLRRGAERIGSESPSRDAGDHERLAVPTTRDEIGALATTLNGMLDRLARSRAEQRAFVADAAHELRSPLANIRTQLEVAERLGEGADLPADLLPEVERLSGIVEDLLVLARAGDTPPRPAEPVDVGEFLAAMADRYAAARVPVTAEPPDPPLQVVVPRADLVRAVANLVDNAVRHARGQVRLSAAGTRTEARLAVSDDGHGIAPPDRERVFDRFARLDEARARDRGGSGLGLAIARALVRRGGGEIRLEDAGPGLRAVVSLPLRQR
jgi:signal transduction histidine kinase